MPAAPKAADASTRKWLAVGIVAASIVGVVGLSAVAILAAGDERPETSRLVFSAVLPLLGTWVGTVLAFYFARANFEAATESTLALAGIETATPVSRVMIPESDFVAYDVGTSERVEDVLLADVRAKMRALTPPSRRLPIRDPSGAVLYVIHDSTLTAYAESQGLTTTTLDKNLGELLSDADFKKLVEAIGFVSEKATVADARMEMTSIENCNDVFVTASGKRGERAIGWLTNTLLAGVQ
jgi:hypothetical protein